MDDQDLRVLRNHLNEIEKEVNAVKIKLDNQNAEIIHLLRHLIEVVEKQYGLQ